MPQSLQKHTLQLREVVLAEISVKRLSDLQNVAPPPVLLDVDSWGVVLSPNEGHSFVKVTLAFEGPSAPFSAEIVYRGTIGCEGQPPQESSFLSFLKTEGIYLVWPYVRQAVSQMTTHMGFPALTLPTLAHSKEITEKDKDANATQGDVFPN